MTRVDLPKNKSKLCQTLSLCFWFRTTKWITKEIFRVHTAWYSAEFKMRIKQVKQGSRVNGLHLPSWEKGRLPAFVFFSAAETMKPQEFFFQAVRNMSPLLSFLLGCSYSWPGPLLIHPFMGGWGGGTYLERELTPFQKLIVLRGSAYFNQNISNSPTLLSMQKCKWPEKQGSLYSAKAVTRDISIIFFGDGAS